MINYNSKGGKRTLLDNMAAEDALTATTTKQTKVSKIAKVTKIKHTTNGMHQYHRQKHLHYWISRHTY